MKRYALTLIVVLSASNVIAAEIPQRFQKKILAAATEMDSNSHGTITA